MRPAIGPTLLVIALCLLPGILFLAFHEPADDRKSAAFPQDTNLNKFTIAAEHSGFPDLMEIPSPPLRVRQETFFVEFKGPGSREPLTTLPRVRVLMPMGDHMMEEPATVQRISDHRLQVTTTFTMAGDWIIEVTPQREKAFEFPCKVYE